MADSNQSWLGSLLSGMEPSHWWDAVAPAVLPLAPTIAYGNPFQKGTVNNTAVSTINPATWYDNIGAAIKRNFDQPGGNPVSDTLGGLQSGVVNTVNNNILHGIVGGAFEVANNNDPSVALNPKFWWDYAHGQPTTGQWDKGLVGTVMNVARVQGQAATGAMIWSRTGFDPGYAKASWNAAFDTSHGNPIDFGEAAFLGMGDLAPGAPSAESFLKDPRQLQQLRGALDNTWYGKLATGTLDMLMYRVLDPTQFGGRLANASRTGMTVAHEGEGDAIARSVNTRADAGQVPTGPSLAAKVGMTAAKTIGARVPPEVEANFAGNRLWASKVRTHGMTDYNQLANELVPRIGEGSVPSKNAAVTVIEAYSKAGRIEDPVLQAQVKVNIDLALTGSQVAREWLARNNPSIAAGLGRASSAPSEFTLLRDAMHDYVAKEGQQIGSFKVSDWVDRHYGTAANKAELKAYGQAIEDHMNFIDNLKGVDFGDDHGTLLVPRTLEKVKTAMRNKVYGEYILQDGATGRTIRYMTGLIQDIPRNGRVNTNDPIVGSRQIQSTLREYANNIGKSATPEEGFLPTLGGQTLQWNDYIQHVTTQFMKAQPAQREALMQELDDHLIQMMANHYGIEPADIMDLMRAKNAIQVDAREYASRQAKDAANNEQNYVLLGDFSGSDTVLRRAHLEQHLRDTVPLTDYKMADALVRGWRDQRGLRNAVLTPQGMARAAATGLRDSASWVLHSTILPVIAWYQRHWRYWMLGKMGVSNRALYDTEGRAIAVGGMMNALNNAWTGARALAERHGLGNGLTQRVEDNATQAMWDAHMAEQTRMTANEIRQTVADQTKGIQQRYTAAGNAADLAEEFRYRAHQRPLPKGVDHFEPAPLFGDDPMFSTGNPGFIAVGPNGERMGTIRYDPFTGDIEDLYVPTAYRRRGIATELYWWVRYENPGLHINIPMEALRPAEGLVGEEVPAWATSLLANRDPIAAHSEYWHAKADEAQALAQRLAGRTRTFGAGPRHIARRDAEGNLITNPGRMVPLKRDQNGRIENFRPTAAEVQAQYRTPNMQRGEYKVKPEGGKAHGVVQRRVERDMNAQRRVDDTIALDAQDASRTSAARTYAQGHNTTTRLVTIPQDHSGYGMALAHSDVEAEQLRQLLGGDNQLAASLLGRGTDDRTASWKIGSGYKDNLRPTSPHWYESLAYALKDYAGSHTVQRLLAEGDALHANMMTNEAVARSFLRDPAVVAEAKKFGLAESRDDILNWIDQLSLSVSSMVQHDAVKAALLQQKVLKAKELRSLIPSNQRYEIYGPNMLNKRAINFNKQGKAAIEQMINNGFHLLLTLPDYYFTRIPLANTLFHDNVDIMMPPMLRRAQEEFDAGKRWTPHLTVQELEDLRSRAKMRAANTVVKHMYDVSRYVGAHAVMSYLAPFYAPWEDALMSWSRLIYDEPKRGGLLLRAYALPDMYHLTVDKDGNQVEPFDTKTPFADKAINIPSSSLPGVKAMFNSVGLEPPKNFRLGVQNSFSTIAQGNYPLTPGAGPLLQLSSAALTTTVLPRLFDGKIYDWMAKNPENPVMQTLFYNGEIPKATFHDMVGTQMPSWLRQVSDVFLGPDGFGNTYSNAWGTRYMSLWVDFRQAHGGREPTLVEQRKLMREADNAAQGAAVLRAALSFGLGISGSAAPQGQYYMDKMHSLVAVADQLKARHLTPEQVFAANFPEAAGLNFRLGENNGQLVATVDAVNAYYKYRSLMKNNPEVMWWIAGPANKTGPFDTGAYNQELTLGLRKKYTPAELAEQMQISVGNYRWDQFKTALDLYMRQHNITSINSKEAGNLVGLQAQFKQALRDQYPGWAKDQDTTDYGKRTRQIEAIGQLTSDPQLRDRPDVITTRKYLLARAAVEQYAHSINITGWQTAKAGALPALRQQLLAYGNQLASQDPIFGTAWNRLLGPEIDPTRLLLTYKPAPSSPSQLTPDTTNDQAAGLGGR